MPTDTRQRRRRTRQSILDAGAEIVPVVLTAYEAKRVTEIIEGAYWSPWPGREVQDYGDIDLPNHFGNHQIQTRGPLPNWAMDLGDRLMIYTHMQATQCAVNRYRPGSELGMHNDGRVFGNVICIVTLAGNWPMRFRRKSEDSRRQRTHRDDDEQIRLPPGSALILRDRARFEWLHGIDRQDGLEETETRIAATFRTLRATVQRSEERR